MKGEAIEPILAEAEAVPNAVVLQNLNLPEMFHILTVRISELVMIIKTCHGNHNQKSREVL